MKPVQIRSVGRIGSFVFDASGGCGIFGALIANARNEPPAIAGQPDARARRRQQPVTIHEFALPEGCNILQ
jgi:hypothetical protein